jgi:hypothetical protein
MITGVITGHINKKKMLRSREEVHDLADEVEKKED